LILISACKQLQENQVIAWFLKTKEKNVPKQETLDFLERIVHRVGETAENQRKTREKSKVAENQVFWLDFCAKKKNCAYPLRAQPSKQYRGRPVDGGFEGGGVGDQAVGDGEL
jgi:hypothetical protein